MGTILTSAASLRRTRRSEQKTSIKKRRAAEPGHREKWEDIFRLLDDTIRDTRALVSELGSPVLYELGLVPALQWLTKKLQEQTGIPIHLENDGRPKSLDENVGVFVYQAVRELLTNVAKHANASHCTVSLAVSGDQVEVQVTDDGKGFDVGRISDTTNADTGFGLFSIQERSEQLGGQFSVSSKSGQGTQIALSLPIDA